MSKACQLKATLNVKAASLFEEESLDWKMYLYGSLFDPEALKKGGLESVLQEEADDSVSVNADRNGKEPICCFTLDTEVTFPASGRLEGYLDESAKAFYRTVKDKPEDFSLNLEGTWLDREPDATVDLDRKKLAEMCGE